MVEKNKKQKTKKVVLDFTDAELFALMKDAHKEDVTFNQYIENILSKGIKKMEKEYAKNKSNSK